MKMMRPKPSKNNMSKFSFESTPRYRRKKRRRKKNGTQKLPKYPFPRDNGLCNQGQGGVIFEIKIGEDTTSQLIYYYW